jgi:NADPH oxidase
MIPEISKYQYHPFTIASSPKDDNLTFLINPVGDWTNSLKDAESKKIGKINNILKIR